jgi:hypothetical protein
LVPDGVTAEAVVRCPLCQVEYLGDEALAMLPPTLIVVRPAAAPAADSIEAKAVAAAEVAEPAEAVPASAEAAGAVPEAAAVAADGQTDVAPLAESPLGPHLWSDQPPDEQALAEGPPDGGDGETIALAEEPEGALDAVDFAAITGKAPPAAAAEEAAAALPRPRKRKKPREASALGRVIGMAVTGALGLACAYLFACWYDARNDSYHIFHKKPAERTATGQASPATPAAAAQPPAANNQPPVVANQPPATSNQPPATNNQPPAKAAPGANPQAAAGSPQAKPSAKTQPEGMPGLDDSAENELPSKGDFFSTSEPKVDVFAPGEAQFKPIEVGTSRPKPLSNPQSKPAVKPATGPGASPPVAPVATPPAKIEVAMVTTVGPRQPPTFDAAKLAAVLAAADAALKGKPPAEITDEDYRKLCRLAEVVTFVQGAADAQKQAVQAVARQLGQSAKGSAKIVAAARKLVEDKAPGGILLTGTVMKITSKDGYQWVAVRPDPSAKAVLVLSDRSLAVKENDPVLIFGAIIAEPTKNLSGYQGSQPVVVWAGLPVVLAR